MTTREAPTTRTIKPSNGMRTPPPSTAQSPKGERADGVIRWVTTASVVVLALIAAAVSYRHMYTLVVQHGETAWTAALLPLSVDGMIAASSMSLLLDSRRGLRGGLLPWVLLIVGSAASLAANVAVAEPSVAGRLIAAWPAFALIGSYELLMRQIRTQTLHSAEPSSCTESTETKDTTEPDAEHPQMAAFTQRTPQLRPKTATLRRDAWRWANQNRDSQGRLPSGAQIARRFDRSSRWGRLVKKDGAGGRLDTSTDDLRQQTKASPVGGEAQAAPQKERNISIHPSGKVVGM